MALGFSEALAAMPESIADQATLEAALEAGLLLSAGGSGRASVARHRQIGEAALARGVVRVVSIEEFEAEGQLIIATGVGAPGQAKNVGAGDCIEAAKLLIRSTGVSPAGVIPGHVPGFYAWLQAADLGVPVADVAANGRGHPTVKMGGMGFAARPDLTITQAGAGGYGGSGNRIRVVAEGNIASTSSVMRHAAVQNDGLIMAARGPLSVSWVREHGAVGAISFQLGLGQRMVEAGANGERRIEAIVDFTSGALAGIGVVSEKTVAYKEGFETGEIRVRCGQSELLLGVCNEYMTLSRDGERIATFPDLIATVDPQRGDALSISELDPGTRVAVIVASKRNFPIGSGVLDPGVYPEVETRMGVEIARYALDPEA
ncbi:MAG: DUF917 family protein [Xanthobacteraceae bacterium]|nr:DUF917 family protein [Xanthobacteraceae bacterium]